VPNPGGLVEAVFLHGSIVIVITTSVPRLVDL
jgi:hypothetical protein